MKYIQGKQIKDIVNLYREDTLKEIFYNIGINIAKIHQTNRIHGDITTSNILINENNEIFFIDFWLTEYSQNLENFSVDLHLFKQVLISTHGEKFNLLYTNFIEGYRHEIKLSSPELNAEAIISNIKEIELRGRYIKKEHRSA